jgi:F-type H+-transporting ATPase subunit gamma
MERADKNIDDLLEALHTTFHRIRQAGIDEKLFDVIAGFEALSTGKESRNAIQNHGKMSARIGIHP